MARSHDRIPDRWEKRHHLSLHHDQGDDESSCDTDALTQGATVAQAELRARRGTATFEKVELAG